MGIVYERGRMENDKRKDGAKERRGGITMKMARDQTQWDCVAGKKLELCLCRPMCPHNKKDVVVDWLPEL